MICIKATCSSLFCFGFGRFRKAWVQSSDFEEHPLDPPLSDAGRAEAEDVAKRIAKFIESKPGSEIQVPQTWDGFAKLAWGVDGWCFLHTK